jgi:hypothetical protein
MNRGKTTSMQQAEVPTTTITTTATTTPAVASSHTPTPLIVFESAKRNKAKPTLINGPKNRRGRPPLRRTLEKDSQPETSPEQANVALDVSTSQRSTRATATNGTVVPWSDPDRILRKKRKRPKMEEAISSDMALIIRGDELPDETLDESDIILDQFIAASQRCRARTNQIS